MCLREAVIFWPSTRSIASVWPTYSIVRADAEELPASGQTVAACRYGTLRIECQLRRRQRHCASASASQKTPKAMLSEMHRTPKSVCDSKDARLQSRIFRALSIPPFSVRPALWSSSRRNGWSGQDILPKSFIRIPRLGLDAFIPMTERERSASVP